MSETTNIDLRMVSIFAILVKAVVPSYTRQYMLDRISKKVLLPIDGVLNVPPVGHLGSLMEGGFDG